METRNTGHEVGDMGVADFPTDQAQAMAQSGRGIIIDSRESDFGQTQLRVCWTQSGDIVWMSCIKNLRVVSKGAQQ